MNWTLTHRRTKVGSINKDVASSTDNPPKVITEPTISYDKTGAVKGMTYRVKQTAMTNPVAIADRVYFSRDGLPIAAAIVVECPSASSSGYARLGNSESLELVTAIGGEELLKKSPVGNIIVDAIQRDEDIYHWQVALKLCQLYAHPDLVISESQFQKDTTPVKFAYFPGLDLYSALSKLASDVGFQVWVGNALEVRFGEP